MQTTDVFRVPELRSLLRVPRRRRKSLSKGDFSFGRNETWAIYKEIRQSKYRSKQFFENSIHTFTDY